MNENEHKPDASNTLKQGIQRKAEETRQETIAANERRAQGKTGGTTAKQSTPEKPAVKNSEPVSKETYAEIEARVNSYEAERKRLVDVVDHYQTNAPHRSDVIERQRAKIRQLDGEQLSADARKFCDQHRISYREYITQNQQAEAH